MSNTPSNPVEASPDFAARVAAALFPEAVPGPDCMAEVGREGQPCRICAAQAADFADKVEEVRVALAVATRFAG